MAHLLARRPIWGEGDGRDQHLSGKCVKSRCGATGADGPCSRGRAARPGSAGLTVSRHFGRAPYYAVLTPKDDVIVERELRQKVSPHLAGMQAEEDTGTGPHGTDPGAQARHEQMARAIDDCSVLIAGGMGQGAHDRRAALGVRPMVTDITDVDAAALACARGELADGWNASTDRPAPPATRRAAARNLLPRRTR